MGALSAGGARKAGHKFFPNKSSEGGVGSGWRYPLNKNGGMLVVVEGG